MQQRQRSRPYFLLTMTLAADLTFTGVIFGWPPLQLVWERESLYAEQCTTAGEAMPCAAMKNRLNLMYTIAATCAVLATLPNGAFLDRFGPRATSALAACFAVIGSLLLAFSDSAPDRSFDGFIPGLACSKPRLFLQLLALTSLWSYRQSVWVACCNSRPRSPWSFCSPSTNAL
jgi:MFS family permease